jgi:spoIIIJ-associated protein
LDRDPKRKPAENEEHFDYSEDFDAYAFGEIQDEAASPDSDAAREILNELLSYMGVRAQVRVTRAASHQPNDNPPYLLNIEGPRTDVLVGRRGDTLAALQYITRLIASRKLGRRANIVIDVEGYKARRSQKLRELAGRMAEQALRDGRTVVLEPMPPHERRIIHMTLRSHPEVSTKSVGEGDARKVTIIPK